MRGHCGARATRGRRANLFGASGSTKDVVGRSLRMCGSVNQKLAIVAQLLEPSCDIGGLIVDHPGEILASAQR